ncbi:HPr family phosphocarrier protein [Nocardia sp. NPDC050630]|uniref:HPr family phosphocarrier protein n=1 Tax=Nocardia sp. NPDC050630 TaxID=3364321 RepID=UPI00378F239E
MIERTVIIGSEHGLHARPAAKFVQQVNVLGVPITIAKDGGDPVDARSIMGVLSQNICHGDMVTLASEAPGAEAALDDLVVMLTTNLDNDAHGHV